MSVISRILHTLRPDAPVSYSNLDEQEIVTRLLARLGVRAGFCVDIGASDGLTMSNSRALFEAGWSGLAVEYDPAKFAALARASAGLPNVSLAKCKVTPENVLPLLQAHSTPERFDFLTLDIDGYDYFVLESILSRYRPSLVVAEVNEKIPPPLKFTVKYDPDYRWNEDHFYGMSVSKLYELCSERDYSLVELHYNNAFLIPSELTDGESLTDVTAYERGYLLKPDRKEKFHWNAPAEPILALPPQEALEMAREWFKGYEGKFELSL